MQDNASNAYLARVEKSFRRDYDGELSAPLVVPSSDATWLEPDRIPNPARTGPCFRCRQSPSRSACSKFPAMARPTCSATPMKRCITFGQATVIRRSAARAMTGDLATLYTLRPGRSIVTTTASRAGRTHHHRELKASRSAWAA